MEALIFESTHVGLANVLCSQKDGLSRNLWTAKAMQKRLQACAKQKSPNVMNMLQLLEAEILVATGKKNKNLAKADERNANRPWSRPSAWDFVWILHFSISFTHFSKWTHTMTRNPRVSITQAYEEYESYGTANKAAHFKRTYPTLKATASKASGEEWVRDS